MHHFLTSLFAAFLMATVASTKTIASIAREEASELERIVYGQRAAAGQFPWAVALHYGGQFICTASIISPNTVLTAAHCVILEGQRQPADVFYGIANVSRSAPQVRIEFADVVAHPDYDDTAIDNDIAILTTTEPVALAREGTQGPRAVCLARPDTDAMEYGTATAMGWGSISPFRLLPIIPDILQYAEQKIVSNRHCAYINPGINEEKICAKGPAWSGICNGDSGGPLVHLSDNQPPVQIGIASYINGIVGCGKFAPGVWTRVSSHVDFVMQNSRDFSAICLV